MKQTELNLGRNKADIWLEWLSSLGGSFTVLSDPTSEKRTGRRDPDTKPRQYPLDDEKYGEHRVTGSIMRRYPKKVKGEK